MTEKETIQQILEENKRRNAHIGRPFLPETGVGCPLPRQSVCIAEVNNGEPVHLPISLLSVPLVAGIVAAGSISSYARSHEMSYTRVSDLLEVARCRHDFCYWAARYVRIKPKSGGEDAPFVLNRPQRRLLKAFEEARLAEKPIRVVVLKARQWGGSTLTQLYIAWLQMLHKKGLNSLIVGHVKSASAEVSAMFDKMLEHYPTRLLDIEEEPGRPGGRRKEKKGVIRGDRFSPLIRHLPLRNCKIKIGSAETPNSARGGDSALVHCTEVAFWRKTDNKTPEDIVRSACAGALYKPLTMIVYESTANGMGNYFHREYMAAKNGESQFKPVFVAWWQIEQYALPIDDEEAFATNLYRNRTREDTISYREETGQYLWYLWEAGATLEAIAWYCMERRKYDDHGDMAAEYPSDDIEAFQHSGAQVFAPRQIEALRSTCRRPRASGDLQAAGLKGRPAIEDLHFVEGGRGLLQVWDWPEVWDEGRVEHRYLCVVDIGGRSKKADWSVICVIDRYWMLYGDKPAVCAQWYGHCDIDQLAWKAVQVAQWYDEALLVIESNTIETHDNDRWVEGGDQAPYIFREIRDVYANLYTRRQTAEEIRNHQPAKYGFHTNVKTKPEIISTLVECVRERLYVERDERCLNELSTYVRRQNGSYGATEGAHDDLLMTRAIGLHVALHEMPLPVVREERKKGGSVGKTDTKLSIW
jgi:hypothetical protein